MRRGGSENFGERLPCQHAHFDRTDYFLRVARGDAHARRGIEARENFVQMRGAARFHDCPKASAQFFRARRSVVEPFEQRAQVKSRSGGDDRQFAAAAQIFEREECVAAIVACGENFVRLDDINEVMWDFFPLALRNLRSPNIEVPVNLRRIADENFAAQSFREFDAQRGFAGGSRAEDDDQAREFGRFRCRRVHVHRDKYQRRSRTINATAASSSAPVTCVRLRFTEGLMSHSKSWACNAS